MKPNHRPSGPKKRFGLLAGITAAIIATAIWQVGWLEEWELHSWDARVRAMAKPADTSSRIIMILLDQKSLDWGNAQMGLSWPWPREMYSAVVDFCNRNEAKSLSFDILFSEPSTYGVQDDIRFARAISRYGKVALPVFLSRSSRLQTELARFNPQPANHKKCRTNRPKKPDNQV